MRRRPRPYLKSHFGVTTIAASPHARPQLTDQSTNSPPDEVFATHSYLLLAPEESIAAGARAAPAKAPGRPARKKPVVIAV